MDLQLDRWLARGPISINNENAYYSFSNENDNNRNPLFGKELDDRLENLMIFILKFKLQILIISILRRMKVLRKHVPI